ncbi:unnamed protein product [Somion occarium]|uniref:Transmembrane protein n=1 Tax=Somion occarium TaxID=3059160 RepID=A0ABP1DN58_9APHY
MPEASFLILFISFLFSFPFIPLARSQDTNATCLSQFGWMTNSRGQSPCVVEAYVEGACHPDGEWTTPALQNTSFGYLGPTVQTANPCSCSSVAFSLLSACAYCQGGKLNTWTSYTTNCDPTEISNGGYHHDISSGTAIPAWAYQPMDATTEKWDPLSAQKLSESGIPDSISNNGNSTSKPPGSPSSFFLSSSAQTIGTAISSSPVAVPSTINGSAERPIRRSSSGAIIGGAVGGGVSALLLVVAGVLLRRYLRTNRAMRAPSRQVQLYLPSSPSYYDEKFPAGLTPPHSANPLLNSQIPVQIYDPFRAGSAIHIPNLAHVEGQVNNGRPCPISSLPEV